MHNSTQSIDKSEIAPRLSIVGDIATNEVSLFHLKYLQGTSNTGEPASQGPFTLGRSTQYEDDIANLLSESKRPNSTIWSLYKKLSDGTPLYVIFTPSETVVWSAECDRDTLKFMTGSVERNNAILCETESSVALICATRKNELLLIPDIFTPEPSSFDLKSPIKAMCSINDTGLALLTFQDKSACTFDVETRKFTKIQVPSLTRFNPFRSPLIGECDQIIIADDVIYGFTSGLVSIFNPTTYQTIKTEQVPKGKPIAVTYLQDSIFILTDANVVIRITGAADDNKPLLIFKEEFEKEIEAFTIVAITQKSCIICGRWHLKVVSFTDLTAGLKISESFDNYLIGCWAEEGQVQTLTSRGGATNIIISEPESSISQVDLLRTILVKFSHGESVHEMIKQYNISQEAFIDLDKEIIEDVSQNIGQRIITHRLLNDLARQCFQHVNDGIFATNLLKTSILRSALKDKFGEFTNNIRTAAKTNDINNVFNIISLNPAIYSKHLLKILESAFTEIRDTIKGSYRKLTIGKNASFTKALQLCLDATEPSSEEFVKLCRYYALTHQDCEKQLTKLFNENPAEAENIAIEAHSYTAIGLLAEISRDFSIIERALKEFGDECINPLISFYSEESKVSCLLEIGKIREFRSPVSHALASNEAALAFNLIQDDSSDEELIKAATLLYDIVRNERESFSISQAASLVSIGIFCCQAAGQFGETDQPLNKLKNRAMIYELQKHYNLNPMEIMDTSDLARHAIKQKQAGTALAIIGSTYDDRTDEQNAELLIDAVLIEPMKNEELRNLLVNTIAAYTVPESLDKVLINKVNDTNRRNEISRAFKFANALIHSSEQKKKHEMKTFHDAEDKELIRKP